MSPFLLKQVTYKTCDEIQLIFLLEEKEISISFFNLIFFDEEKRMNACKYLQDAKKIQLEEEPLSNTEYYIFTDDVLFQKKAIEEKWARASMNYEGYLYDLSEHEMIVSAHTKTYPYETSSYWIVIILLVLTFLSIWIVRKL